MNHFTCKVRGWTRLFLSCLYLYYLYSVKHTSNGSEEGKSRVLVGKQWRAQIQGESVEPYHKSTDPKPPILALYTEQLQRNFPRLGTVSATPTVSYYKEAPYGPRDGAGLKAPSSGDRQCTGKPRAGALQASGPLTLLILHTQRASRRQGGQKRWHGKGGRCHGQGQEEKVEWQWQEKRQQKQKKKRAEIQV